MLWYQLLQNSSTGLLFSLLIFRSFIVSIWLPQSLDGTISGDYCLEFRLQAVRTSRSEWKDRVNAEPQAQILMPYIGSNDAWHRHLAAISSHIRNFFVNSSLLSGQQGISLSRDRRWELAFSIIQIA